MRAAVRKCDAPRAPDLTALHGAPQGNYFPQLCINFTNEMLHDLFIDHVVMQEQKIYQQEGTGWQMVDYQDNQHVLDLIAGKSSSLFSLLDDQCKTGRGTDETVLEAYHASFGGKSGPTAHAGYAKPARAARTSFAVKHYAQEVTYAIEGFVELNKDELSADVTTLLEAACGFERLRLLAQADVRFARGPQRRVVWARAQR